MLEPNQAGCEWRWMQRMGLVRLASWLQQWLWNNLPLRAVHAQVPGQPAGLASVPQ